MNKALKWVIAIIVLIALALIGLSLWTNYSKQQAQQQGEEANSIFHTVPEGGECRPAMGDCETGLTCGEDNTCVKP